MARELNGVLAAKCCNNPYCFGRCPVAQRLKSLKAEVRSCVCRAVLFPLHHRQGDVATGP